MLSVHHKNLNIHDDTICWQTKWNGSRALLLDSLTFLLLYLGIWGSERANDTWGIGNDWFALIRPVLFRKLITATNTQHSSTWPPTQREDELWENVISEVENPEQNECHNSLDNTLTGTWPSSTQKFSKLKHRQPVSYKEAKVMWKI